MASIINQTREAFQSGKRDGVTMGDVSLALDAAMELLRACRALQLAYQNGADNEGAIDWADLDEAHRLAVEAINKATR